MALRPRPANTPMARAFEGAFESGIAVVVGVALGYYSDRWLGTEPVFLFVGLIVGAVAGFRRLLKIEWPQASDPKNDLGPEQAEDPGDKPGGSAR